MNNLYCDVSKTMQFPYYAEHVILYRLCNYAHRVTGLAMLHTIHLMGRICGLAKLRKLC